MAVPNTFAGQIGSIPLSELDTNFATPITIGTTTVALGSTATTLDNVTLTSPALGTPLSGNLSACTGVSLTSGVSSILPVLNGGTGVTTSTGTGSVVLNTTPTLVTPILGTPTSGDLTNCTIPVGSITGTLPVLSGGTGVTTSTGSGDTVLSTSPTLVTPALGTPTSGVVTNLTGTASININGTVGATTATTGAFTTLAYTGTLTGNTGVVAIGTNQIYKDASGNVGIGTSSPTTILDIYRATNANLTVRGDGATSIIPTRNSTDGAGPNINFRKARGTAASQTAVANGDFMGQIAFSAYGGTTNRTIAQIFGGVGIYTSDTDISSFIMFTTTPTGSITPVERLRIDSSGNVGIGTSSPTGKLDVAGTIKTLGYTVATLPAGVVGARAYVTDALAPTFGATVVTGGAITIPVFYNGTNWIVG